MQVSKVLFVGNACTGKTLASHTLIGETLPAGSVSYTPTLGAEVHPILHQGAIYNIWDCAGDVRYKGVGGAYYAGAHLAFIFCGGGGITPGAWEARVRNIPNIQVHYISGPIESRAEEVLSHL